MDIIELQNILALAKHRNFTSAAEACNISQSALSKHLAKIENELGNVSLFDRSRRPITLTIAGEEFVQHASKIVEANNLMLDSMEKYKYNSTNSLVIGTIPVIGRFGFQRIIKEFKSTLTVDTNIDLVDRPTKELLKLLEKKEIDIAIIVLSPSDALGNTLTYYPLLENELCLIMNKKHSLSKRSSVDLSEVSNEMFALADSETGLYDICRHACALANTKLNKVKSFRNIETILDLVEDGDYLSLMTARLLSTYKRNEIKAIHLTHPSNSVIALTMRNTSFPNSITMQFSDFALKHKDLLL